MTSILYYVQLLCTHPSCMHMSCHVGCSVHVVHVLIAVKEESSKRGGGEDFAKMINKRADGESTVEVLKGQGSKK